MITFGGRPLNTYRGGSSKSNEYKSVPIKDIPIEVQQESVTFNSVNIQNNSTKNVNQEFLDSDLNSGPIESFESNGPVVIKVQPESVTLAQPGSEKYKMYEQESILKQGSNSNPNSFTIGGTVLNDKELVKLDKQLIRARFKNGFFAKIFGVEIVTACIYIVYTSQVLFFLFKIFIFFCVCSILYSFIQLILTVSHGILDFILLILRPMSEYEIKIPGIPGIKPFGGLGNAVRDIEKANNSFPRKAYILIIDMMKAIIESLPDTIVSIFEGVFNGIGEIFK